MLNKSRWRRSRKREIKIIHRLHTSYAMAFSLDSKAWTPTVVVWMMWGLEEGQNPRELNFLRDDEVETGLWCPFLGWNVLLLAKYQKGPSLSSRRVQDSEPLNWERYPLKHIGNICKTRLELEHEIWGCSSVVGCSVVSRPWVHSPCTQSLSW